MSAEPTWKPWEFDACEDCGSACEILTAAKEGCAYDGDAARCTECGATGGICCDSETRPSIIWNLDDEQCTPCAVRDSNGRHCPEPPTKLLRRDGEVLALCDRCYLNVEAGAYASHREPTKPTT